MNIQNQNLLQNLQQINTYIRQGDLYRENPLQDITQTLKAMQNEDQYLQENYLESQPGDVQNKLTMKKRYQSKASNSTSPIGKNSYPSTPVLKGHFVVPSQSGAIKDENAYYQMQVNPKPGNENYSRCPSALSINQASYQEYSGNKLDRAVIEDDDRIQTIKSRLKTVFTFYASFGDRINIHYLKSNKFHKMMLDSGIRDTVLTQKRLDLLFVAENKHKANMDFDTFLSLISRIALEKYSESCRTASEALQMILDQNFMPLYQNIMRETDLGEDEIKFKEELDPTTLTLVQYVAPILYRIYTVYFPWEPKCSETRKKITERSENALFNFLKEFDICPSLITKSTAFLLYNDIIETEFSKLSHCDEITNVVPYLDHDIGTVFTLSRFYVYLIRSALIGFSDSCSNYAMYSNCSNAEKLLVLLERMELSTGFLNIEKKTHLTHNSKTSLLIPKDVLRKIFNDGGAEQPTDQASDQSMMSDKKSCQRSQYDDLRVPGATTQRQEGEENKSFISDNSRITRSSRKADFLNISPATLSVIELYREPLQKIFQFYCSLGEPMNTTKMKSIKLIKLLSESGLMNAGENEQSTNNNNYSDARTISKTDLDIIFVKLVGTKVMRELNDKQIKSPNIGYSNHLFRSSGNSINGKFELEHFIKALEMIALKLYPDVDLQQSLTFMLEHHILKTLNEKDDKMEERSIGGQHIQLLMEILKDEAMVELLGMAHKSFLVFYKYYADSRGLLNFERFVKFSKDFSVFPDIVPKAKLMRLFYTLASIHSSTENPTSSSVYSKCPSSVYGVSSEEKFNDQPEQDLIDEHLFIEALALISFEIPYPEPQPGPQERVCFFLERLNQSEGPIKIQKALGHTRSPLGGSWDILSQIRKRYPYIFGISGKENLLKHTQPRMNFDELLKTNGE